MITGSYQCVFEIIQLQHKKLAAVRKNAHLSTYPEIHKLTYYFQFSQKLVDLKQKFKYAFIIGGILPNLKCECTEI